MSATVILNTTRRKRLEAGHPWIYANEIDRTIAGHLIGDADVAGLGIVNLGTH